MFVHKRDRHVCTRMGHVYQSTPAGIQCVTVWRGDVLIHSLCAAREVKVIVCMYLCGRCACKHAVTPSGWDQQLNNNTQSQYAPKHLKQCSILSKWFWPIFAFKKHIFFLFCYRCYVHSASLHNNHTVTSVQVGGETILSSEANAAAPSSCPHFTASRSLHCNKLKTLYLSQWKVSSSCHTVILHS